MSEKIKIMIACHKKCDVPDDPVYLPIHVGAAGKNGIGFIRDDTGDNISCKNFMYCELTGLYWCWKNQNYDYLGLSHYRRYFTLKSKGQQKKCGQLKAVLTEDEARKLLKKYKVIVPKKRNYYIESVYSHYAHTFSKDQLDIALEILSHYWPEYVPGWEKAMKSKTAYIFNMFIMNKQLVDDYCGWLFEVLKKLEIQIDSSQMTPFEARYIGRISERLFNAWINYKIEKGDLTDADIHEIPYLYIGKLDWYHKITGFLKAKFFGKKYEKSF